MKRILYIPTIIIIFMGLVFAKQTPHEKLQLLPTPSGFLSSNNPTEIETLLKKSSPNLKENVINKALTTIKCASKTNIQFNSIIAIIDYSMPSNEKRLWVFDLTNKKLLYNTYVTHGLRSGELMTQYFSNKNNSKASSMGIFKTDKDYYGRHGLSLKLNGLDRCFNDNAANRSIVMHGSWYAEEYFIKKYKRAGRSWGCPAVPDSQYANIINTLKNNALFIVYYPNDDWFLNSKFLACSSPNTTLRCKSVEEKTSPPKNYQEEHEPVVFVDKSFKKGKLEETSPIVATSVNNYEKIFNHSAPLNRMLRRKINKTEYIALSTAELKNLYKNKERDPKIWHELSFMLPVLTMNNGYFATEMQPVKFGEIKEIIPQKTFFAINEHFTVIFNDQKPPLKLVATKKFIRWLGL